jgi:probable HAF family extracellular repeat protein
MNSYNIQTVDFTGDTFTELLGINNEGTIVGLHGTVNQGFSLTLPSNFTAENPPGAAMTDVVGINNGGVSTGFFVDANGKTHGFTDTNGVFATLDAPNTAFNQLLGINDQGAEAGYSSLDPAGQVMQLAYVRQANGTYSYLDNANHTALLPTNVNSQATGINNAGQVVGFFMPTATTSEGFIDNGGSLTVLQAPGSTFTQALGENNQGQVVGFYNDANGNSHGFVYSGGIYTTVDQPGATSTTINGINDNGQIVGFDVDAAGNTNGLTATLPLAKVTDVTAGTNWQQALTPYNGPVPGLNDEFIDVTSHNLNITTKQSNVFLHSGSGDDALQVTSGQNVLDGGTGSNFLVGGSGTDTFFVDARGATSDIWSTMVNFHGGDNATVWGVSPKDFSLSWLNDQGATGYSGLTLNATAPGKPIASLTLAGFSTADLGNGRLSVSFGTDAASGSAYMSIHANS